MHSFQLLTNEMGTAKTNSYLFTRRGAQLIRPWLVESGEIGSHYPRSSAPNRDYGSAPHRCATAQLALTSGIVTPTRGFVPAD